jgi:DNA topoisomerase-1
VDESGKRQSVTSGDVNDYLRAAGGEEFTAKDFRTWAGTVLAAMALQEFEKFDSQALAKKNVVKAIENVAKRLGNTPGVCRKCYVHPAVIDAYLEGAVAEIARQQAQRELTRGMHRLEPEEAAVLALLQAQLAAQAQKEDLVGRLEASLEQTRRKPVKKAGASSL